jgi:hypothetical protein
MVYDVVLVRGNPEEVNNRLDKWRLGHKGKGLSISRNKLEFIEYDFRGSTKEWRG